MAAGTYKDDPFTSADPIYSGMVRCQCNKVGDPLESGAKYRPINHQRSFCSSKMRGGIWSITPQNEGGN